MIKFKETKSLKDYDSVSLAEQIRTHFVETFPVALSNKASDAIQVASYLHRGTVRRGARGNTLKPPYIEHPLRVAIRLYKYFSVVDPDIIIAAILHDTVEDHSYDFNAFQGVSILHTDSEEIARMRALDFIAHQFGYRVASIVEMVSNPIAPAGQTKPEKLAAYHNHIVHVLKVSPEAAILKFSDFVDNAGSLHHHHEYGDKQVLYFVDRYMPLIPLYREAFSEQSTVFIKEEALARLKKVEDNLMKFKESV